MKLQRSFTKALTLAALTTCAFQPMEANSKIVFLKNSKLFLGVPLVGTVLTYFGYNHVAKVAEKGPQTTDLGTTENVENKESVEIKENNISDSGNENFGENLPMHEGTQPGGETPSHDASQAGLENNSSDEIESSAFDTLKKNFSELMTFMSEKTESVCGSVAKFVGEQVPCTCEFVTEHPKTTTTLVIGTAVVATYAAYQAYKLARAYVAAKYAKKSLRK